VKRPSRERTSQSRLDGRVAFCLLAVAACSALAGIASPASASPVPGELYAFGNNRLGQLGNETNIETQEPNPTPLPVTLPGQDGPVIGAAGGVHHSLAVTGSGQLYAFGYNFYGQLGNATNNEFTFEPPLPPEPVTLPGEDGPVTKAVAGCDFSLAVTGSGQLYAFGENWYGQLGNETNVEVGVTGKANPTPTLVTLPGATGGVVEAAAGCDHSLALTSTGQLYAFGHNYSGELGYERSAGPGENAHPTPTLVTLPGQDGPVVQIAAGSDFSLALTESGQLYSFGDNRYGQLGFAANSGPGPDPSENAHPTPTLVDLPGTDSPIVQITAGTFHTLVLTESGQLYGFGSNRFGELGNTTNNGTEEPNSTPTSISLPGANGHIARIAAGYEDSFVLTSAGQLYSFGWNWYGQLGRSIHNKTNQPNPTPTVVAMPGGAATATVAASTDHTLATIGMLLTTRSLPDGTVGAPYEGEVQAAGGEAPYQWSATGLPPGLAIDPGNGEISGDPTNAACGHATCHYTATVTATDSNGMQASKQLSISIAGNTYPLTVTTDGSGSGQVNSSPTGIVECSAAGGTCEASYVDGSTVTLTAQPAADSVFSGWSGGGCAGTGTCRVTLSADTNVTAIFDKRPLPAPQSLLDTLAIKLAGDGVGSVRDDMGSISCPSACSHDFANGTQVTLTATPSPGSRFSGWSGGGCSGTGACRLMIGADTTVTASFTKTRGPSRSRLLVSYYQEGGIGGPRPSLVVFKDRRAKVTLGRCMARFELRRTAWRKLEAALRGTHLHAIAGSYPPPSGSADEITYVIRSGPDTVRIAPAPQQENEEVMRNLKPLFRVLDRTVSAGERRMPPSCKSSR
jgi:alpha-tubulin suppressor-like RCC1 family protein